MKNPDQWRMRIKLAVLALWVMHSAFAQDWVREQMQTWGPIIQSLNIKLN